MKTKSFLFIVLYSINLVQLCGQEVLLFTNELKDNSAMILSSNCLFETTKESTRSNIHIGTHIVNSPVYLETKRTSPTRSFTVLETRNKRVDESSMMSASILDIQLDGIGSRWTILSIGGFGNPLITYNKIDFFRIGLSLSLFDLYKSKDISPVLYYNRGAYGSPDSSKYGFAMGLFPISARLSVCSWHTFGENGSGDIYLYCDYWWLRGVMHGAFNPALDDTDSESPTPKRFIESGIGINPFGALIQVKLFYRYVSIPAENKTEVNTLPNFNYTNVYTSWSFKGYEENRFGVSIVINLGFNGRKSD